MQCSGWLSVCLGDGGRVVVSGDGGVLDWCEVCLEVDGGEEEVEAVRPRRKIQ